MKIAFLLYPTEAVNVQEDSSFWIMLELIAGGHEVVYFESKHLFWQDKAPHAFVAKAKLHPQKGYSPPLFGEKAVNLADFDCIFIRKEPPFDNAYLYCLQLLEMIKDKVWILNDPAGIALANEKTFTLRFGRYAPQTMVTENTALATKFIKNLGRRVIVKPLNQKGGAGIFTTFPKDKNLPSLLAMATSEGSRKVLIQRFVVGGHQGDKRLVVLDGKILGAFSRRPPSTDFRANLSVGASMHRAAVTAQDRKLVDAMAPLLAQYGLWFVGLDVIGNYLTEVNVTSPAGIPEINRLDKTRLEKRVVDFMERRLGCL
jgi:glutathione synthase